MALGLGALLLMMFPRVLYSYEEVIVKDGATIRGAVKLDGKLRRRELIFVAPYFRIHSDAERLS